MSQRYLQMRTGTRSRKSRSLHGSGCAIQELLSNELVEVCLVAMRAYGLDVMKILRSQLTRSAQRGRAPIARKIFRDAYWLSELATEWTENPKFVDATGRPQVIPIHGTNTSFAALTRKYFGRRKLSEVLDLAFRTRVIERVGSDKVAQRNACVMLTGNPILLLARAVLCVRWLLKVTESNGIHAAVRSGLLPERMAFSVIPDKRSAQFANVMRPQLSNAIEMGNRWLSKYTVRNRAKDIDRKGGLVGIHAYVFRD